MIRGESRLRRLIVLVALVEFSLVGSFFSVSFAKLSSRAITRESSNNSNNPSPVPNSPTPNTGSNNSNSGGNTGTGGPSTKNTGGGQVNGKGGGQLDGGSCMSQAQKIDHIEATQAGMKPGNMSMAMTDRGPVFKVCGTEIASDPSAFNKKQESKGQESKGQESKGQESKGKRSPSSTDNSSEEKQIGWCVKNNDLAKQTGGEGNQFHCGDFQQEGKSDNGGGGGGAKSSPRQFKISCNGKDFVGQVLIDKDKNNRVTNSRLQIRSKDADDKQFVELKESYQSSGKDQVKGVVSAALLPKSPTYAGQEAGAPGSEGWLPLRAWRRGPSCEHGTRRGCRNGPRSPSHRRSSMSRSFDELPSLALY
jgi:hypothetical protein